MQALLPHMSVVVLVLAVVVRLTRPPPRRRLGRSFALQHPKPKVMLALPMRGPWRERVQHVVACGQGRWSVDVLLLCSDPAHVRDLDVHDSLFTDLDVHVEVGTAEGERDPHPNRQLRRLAKRFVTGHEPVVFALLGRHVAPHREAAATLNDVARWLRDGLVVSCPPPTAEGAAQFPRLRTRSTGALARDASRPFPDEARRTAVQVVPSVCWCPEATVARGGDLLRFAAGQTTSFVAQTRTEGTTHAVPSHSLLDLHAEDDMIDHDDGADGLPLHPNEAVGLTPKAASAERVCKYGSSLRARIAVQQAAHA
jgi:hypothetical protein